MTYLFGPFLPPMIFFSVVWFLHFFLLINQFFGSCLIRLGFTSIKLYSNSLALPWRRDQPGFARNKKGKDILKHKLKYSQSILAFISAFKLSKQAHKRHRFPIPPLIRLIFHFSEGLIFNFMKTLRRLNCTNWYIAKNDTCKLLIQNSS